MNLDPMPDRKPERAADHLLDLDELLLNILMNHTGDEPRPEPPVILFDENVDLPTVVPVVRAAIGSTALMSRQLWSQLRQRSDGTFIHLEGRPIGALPEGEEWGEPVKGWSVPDAEVVKAAIANFVTADRSVVLSANVRGDPQGLRKLLTDKVAPVLEANHRGRFGMLAFMKGRKTPWSTYASALARRLEGASVGIGFEYYVVRRSER